MRNQLSILLFACASMLVISRARAHDGTDYDEGSSSPLMMFFDPKRRSEENREREERETRRRLHEQDRDDQVHQIEEGRGDDFSGFIATGNDKIEPMISCSDNSTSSLEQIKAVIASFPKTQQLFPTRDQKSLTASGSWYGGLVRFVEGDHVSNKKARAILRGSLSQQYGAEVAQRICPQFHDQRTLSAPQAAALIKMAPTISQRQSEYPLATTHDEKMESLIYARDTALVAQAAVAAMLEVKTRILESVQQQSVINTNQENLLQNHPEFIAAREDAKQATQHALENAAFVVEELKKGQEKDSSFGIQDALSAAEHSVAMARRALVKTGRERDLDYKAEEALASAVEAHDAYQAYQESKRRILKMGTGSEVLTERTHPTAVRKERLQETLKNVKAIGEYAIQTDQILGDLSNVMATFDPFGSVPITEASLRIRPIVEDINTKTQCLTDTLAKEEQIELPSTAEDQFCREAAVQRLLASSQRTIAALESTIENARKIAVSKAELFFQLHPSQRSHLDSINAVQQAYQAQRAFNTKTDIKK